MKTRGLQCIICGSTDTTLLFRTRDRHYGIQEEFDLIRCVGCGLVRLDPMPTEKELAGYYAGDYYAYQPFEKIPWWKRLLIRVLRLRIKTHNPKFQRPGNFLDIGCGSGEYLRIMKERGWKVSGVEPSLYGAQAGQRNGFAIFHGTLTEANFPDSSFDYVRSNHSFEHIPNPVETLEEIQRILRPGGKLFIGIPNIDSLPFRIFGRYWWSLGAPVHTYSYSAKTITELLKQANFRIEQLHYNSNFVSLLGSLQIYANRNTNKRSTDGWLLKNPFLKVPANFMEQCIDLFHKGDAIEVICEKQLH